MVSNPLVLLINNEKEIMRLNRFFTKRNIKWSSGHNFLDIYSISYLCNKKIEITYYVSPPKIRFNSYSNLEKVFSVKDFLKEKIYEQRIFEYFL